APACFSLVRKDRPSLRVRIAWELLCAHAGSRRTDGMPDEMNVRLALFGGTGTVMDTPKSRQSVPDCQAERPDFTVLLPAWRSPARSCSTSGGGGARTTR